MWVRAIWANDNPQSETELIFNAGDIIYVYELNGDWYDGELNGVRGFFPSNFVEPYDEEPGSEEPYEDLTTVNAVPHASPPVSPSSVPPPAPFPVTSPSTPTPVPTTSTTSTPSTPSTPPAGGFVEREEKRDSGGAWHAVRSPTIELTQSPVQRVAKALWAYQAVTDREVSFAEGETITNVVTIDDEWLEGTTEEGAVGCFPKSYVEEVSITTPPASRAKLFLSGDWEKSADEVIKSKDKEKKEKKGDKKEKTKEEKERKEKEKEERARQEKERKGSAKEEKERKEKEDKEKKREQKEKEKQEREEQERQKENAKKEARERAERERKEKEEQDRLDREQKKERDRLFKEEQRRIQEEQRKVLEEQRAAELAKKIKENEDEIARMREQRDREHLEWEKEQQRLLQNLEEQRKIKIPYDPSKPMPPPPRLTKPTKPAPAAPKKGASPAPASPSAVSPPATPPVTPPTIDTSSPVELSSGTGSPSAALPVGFRPPPPPGSRPKAAPPSGPPPRRSTPPPKPRKDSFPTPLTEKPVTPPASASPQASPTSFGESPQQPKLSLSKLPRSVSPPPKPTLASIGSVSSPPIPARSEVTPPLRESSVRAVPLPPQFSADAPRVVPPPKPKTKPAPPPPIVTASSPTPSYAHSPNPRASLALSDDGETWRFKVMYPGKPRPVWVACSGDETVGTLRAAIAEKGNLNENQIVLVFDDAELDVADVVRMVVKNEAIILVELQ